MDIGSSRTGSYSSAGAGIWHLGERRQVIPRLSGQVARATVVAPPARHRSPNLLIVTFISWSSLVTSAARNRWPQERAGVHHPTGCAFLERVHANCVAPL